jgi:nickel/cobalt transporter (NiCoT) family protein
MIPLSPVAGLSGLRGRVGLMAAFLVLFTVLAWGWALIAFHHHPALLGSALVAYGFGLRHAVDADHIAAIDNVTRKLMQEGQRPLGVGLFFSLGHSTVVVLLSLALVLTTSALQGRFADLKAVGGLVGTSVSAFFLFAIATANIMTLRGFWGSFGRVRRERAVAEADLVAPLAGGVMGRLFHRLFRLIGRSWHMYPLGFLFGLGFDTATEVGLLGLSAIGAAQGLSLWSILVFPALFSVGMATIDTADGVLMLGAYGWAFVRPVRKLYYNLSITLVSVMAALLTGTVEVLGLVSDGLHGDGPFWAAIDAVNDNLGAFGCGIVALCALGWLASFVFYRLKGFDRMETTGAVGVE